MSEETQNKYMLIFRGTDWYKGLSAEEMQQVSDNWLRWFKGLTDNGKAIAGNPLEREGKIVSSKNGRIVADGPFAESKETIGGYFLLLSEAFLVSRANRPRALFELLTGAAGTSNWRKYIKSETEFAVPLPFTSAF